MDDGSTSPEESVKMLEMLSRQGVETVCLTSHYYHHREKIDSFLRRREKALESLKGEIEKEGIGHKLPGILLGAEIKVEQDLVNEDKLNKLCFTGTKSLLLEMPFVGLDARTVELMENISFKYDVTVVVAHLDRYIDLLTKDDLQRVINIPNSVIQINAEAFEERKLRKFILQLFDAEVPVVFGTDAHGIKERKPIIEGAYSFIESKLSQYQMHDLSRAQKTVLEGSTEGGVLGYAY